MNKKGGVQDLLFAIALFFAIGMISLVAVNIGSNVLGGIKNAGVAELGPNEQLINDTLDDGVEISGMGDTVFLIIFAGYSLVLLLTALATEFNPAYFILFFMISILGVVIAVPFSNAYEQFYLSDAFNSYAGNFTITSTVMSNLPFVIGAMSLVLLVVTYARARTGKDLGFFG
jgi:hypothetical protein